MTIRDKTPFGVVLPLAPDPPMALIVEDQPTVRAYLARRVRHASPDTFVIEAASGEEAMRIVAGQRLDLIVTDFRLPGMDGVEFLVRARALAPDVPRILVTGYGDSEVAQRAVNEGHVQAFFGKPAVSEDFERSVRSLVEAHAKDRHREESLP